MTDRVLIIEFRVRYSDRHRAIPAIPDEMEKYLRSHPKTNDRRHPVRVNLTGCVLYTGSHTTASAW
jgi:hypothetical protein|tara:strand:+ start:376 stop:573 length:198 start_codon:yes stop_codon:yes gene_type:complete